MKHKALMVCLAVETGREYITVYLAPYLPELGTLPPGVVYTPLKSDNYWARFSLDNPYIVQAPLKADGHFKQFNVYTQEIDVDEAKKP